MRPLSRGGRAGVSFLPLSCGCLGAVVIRRFAYRLWVATAGLLVTVALLMALTRLLLPQLTAYREELVGLLSEQLDLPLAVASIDARWHGLGPRITFHGLTLRERQGGRELLRLESAMIDIDVPRSLWHGVPQVTGLVLNGVRLAVTRHADGSLSVMGRRGSPRSAEIDARDVLQWLAQRRRITIRKGTIDWRDELRGGAVRHFHDIAFRLRNEGARHRLEGQVRLTREGTQQLSFILDLRGDLTSSQWSGDLYLAAGDLELEALPWSVQAGGLHFPAGSATLQLWGRWEAGRLQRLSGRVGLRDLRLMRKGEPASTLRIDKAGGDFLWQRWANGWQLAIDGLRFGRGDRLRPPTAFQVRWKDDGQGASVRASLGYLELEDLGALRVLAPALPSRLAEALDGLAPRGVLQDVYLAYCHACEDDAEQVPTKVAGKAVGPRFHVAARFAGLSTSPWRGLPGLRNLAGRLVVDEGGGTIVLDGQEVRLDFTPLFRDALVAQALSGRLFWRRTAGGWSVQGRDLAWRDTDLALTAQLDLDLPVTGTPRLDLEARFAVASLEHTSRYLPVAVMRPGLVKWLDRAIVAGRVPAGEARFHGLLNGAAFASGGDFEVRFNVLDGVLDYAPGWPRIDEVEAGFLFRKRGMEVTLAEGRSLSSRLDGARIVITDLAAQPAVLEVEGRAAGPTKDVLRFLRESPLRERFATYLADLDAFGESRLELTLRKPLAPHRPAEVSGALALRNSILVVGKERPLQVKALNGELRFSGAGLFAEDLRGRILGLDSRIDVDTLREEGGMATHIRAQGRIEARAVANLVPLPLLLHLRGETSWQADLRLPPAGVAAGESTLEIRSDLRGMTIALPEPLFKGSDESLALTLRTRLPRDLDAPVTFQLGALFRGIMDLDPHLRFERGELLFGSGFGQPRLPAHRGLRLRGVLENFSYSQWHPYLAEAADGEAPLLRSLDLRLEQLEVMGRDFHDVTLQGELEDEIWEFVADSRELQGYIEYPLATDLPVIMELDYLRIPRQPSPTPADPGAEETPQTGATDMDPRELPPLVVRSRRLDYGDIEFRNLDLRASRHPAGIRFDRITLDSPFISLRIRGTWIVAGDGSNNSAQRSIFNIIFDSPDLGKAMALLGFRDNIKNGRAHMELVGQWPGDPMSFSPDRVNGNLSLRIEDGRLLEVEPGAGRIFGLVSLQALPRRLSLDFSDIFDKGFSFDEIEGSFVIRDGDAFTRDLTMKGPAARILAEGRVGLRARDYDQVVTVIPQLTSGLPVAGAVAGGIGVGAVILLAEQILKEEIDKMTQVKYRVTGSWDAPRVRRFLERNGRKDLRDNGLENDK